MNLAGIDWLVTFIIVAVGFLSGVMAALVGVGGAVITTPLIRFMGASPIAAVGSTVPAILPGAISGSLRYHREGYIKWRPVMLCGCSGAISAVAGAWVADLVDGRYLMILTAMLVLWSGTSLVRSASTAGLAQTADDMNRGSNGAVLTPANHGTAGVLVSLGLAAGFLAGLLGIGGGVLLTPGLALLAKLPVKNAIATSLASVAIMSVSALVTHIALGHVDWAFAAPLAVGIVPGARVGAAITVGATERKMRLVAGSVLVAIGLLYAARELMALK